MSGVETIPSDLKLIHSSSPSPSPFPTFPFLAVHPINLVTELRAAHAKGVSGAGINVKKNKVTDMYAENVLQPLLVSTSALNLATETVCMILKIDDLVVVM